MKAVRLTEIGKPLQLHEVPVPRVGARDALVRIKAAGVCHSDVHYQAGISPMGPLPQTLGHEIAGTIEEIGKEVTSLAIGDRVCLHYLVTCGHCDHCRAGREQFCVQGQMLGKHRDGGYADFIAVPARNAVLLPEAVSFEHGAVLMCSASTSYHALRKARLEPGETVAIFGVGGLGMSAVQLARAFGALNVYAVDIDGSKLELASDLGAIPVDAADHDPVSKILQMTGGRGVDVALELIGLKQTMEQAVRSLGIMGRAVLVGIADAPLSIDSYKELLCKEAEVIGASDHLLWELPTLIEFVRQGRLDLSRVVTQAVPLEADAVNEALDALARFGPAVRTVIQP
jgi:propanol-preferring alcohol dehydrogenase